MSEQIEKISFQDRVSNFFNENKKLLIIITASIIIIISIIIFYKNFQEKKNIEIAERYIQATSLISKDGKNKDEILKAKLLLENIINNKHKFYSPLALYFLIDNDIEKDSKKILAHFDKVIEHKYIDEESINLIKIKKVLFLFSIEDEDLIIKTLNPIINSNSAWRIQAINLIADYFSSKGEKIKAEEYYKLLDIKSGQ